jgi:hypothetical protein
MQNVPRPLLFVSTLSSTTARTSGRLFLDRNAALARLLGDTEPRSKRFKVVGRTGTLL